MYIEDDLETLFEIAPLLGTLLASRPPLIAALGVEIGGSGAVGV